MKILRSSAIIILSEKRARDVRKLPVTIPTKVRSLCRCTEVAIPLLFLLSGVLRQERLCPCPPTRVLKS